MAPENEVTARLDCAPSVQPALGLKVGGVSLLCGRKASIAKLLAPSKHTGFWCVIKNFAQTLRGKIGLSHDAVLSQIGQKLTCVSAHGGLRYFNLEQA
jgi:hypothetical protein